MIRLIHALRDEMTTTGRPWKLMLLQPLLAMLPYMTLLRTRTLLYRLGGIRIGKGSVILGMLRLWGRKPLTIGSGCTINTPCAINLDAEVSIGNSVYIGNDVMILTVTHQIGSQYLRTGPEEAYPVRIEDGVWIAARATILPGVTVGTGSIIAAGAVVTRNVAPQTMVGGVPARLIRNLPVEQSAQAEQSAPVGLR